jgi:hypothetical protein
MKAITLIQPWATLIVIGHKRYETRSWRTRHRGQLLIHAGLKVDSAYLARPEVAALLGDRPVPTGCLVGVCNLLDCFPTEDVHGTIGDVERLVGDFVNGRYAWQLRDVREFREPTPCRGALGVWNAPPNMGTTLADLPYFPVVETATQSANGHRRSN